MKPIDIENALQSTINTISGVTASAIPLPTNYESHLPFVCVTRIGGSTQNIVVDVHNISCDVYAGTWSAATSTANSVVEKLRAIEVLDSCQVYEISCDMPYANSDPFNPVIPQITINATIYVRSKHDNS